MGTPLRWFGGTGPLLLLPLLAAGCAVPPAVTVASFAADGVSYVATGKSVTDHGISAATGHDCALLRPVLDDKPVCDTTETAAAKLVPVEYGAPAPPPARADIPRDQYVVVGSFLDPANAARAVARYAPMKASIVDVEIQGRHFHRVVVGPLSTDEAAGLKLRLASD
jgi:SPOR domain